MASHRRFEERPLKPMTAKFTHIGRVLFPLPRGEGQGEGQTGTSVFTVLTESRKQELTEYKTNTKLALFWHLLPLILSEIARKNAKPTLFWHLPPRGGTSTSYLVLLILILLLLLLLPKRQRSTNWRCFLKMSRRAVEVSSWSACNSR